MTTEREPVRMSESLTDSEWEQYEDLGYIRLGIVYPENRIRRLCDRIDEIMLGSISYEGMFMQLCPSANGDENTLKYGKIQDLERDPLYLEYMSQPIFRHITRKLLGEEVSVFRAMFFNKPANGGVPLVWHQDGRFWDMDRYPQMTIYTALDRATRENGCVQIIPRSHVTCPIHTVETEEDTATYAPPEQRVFLEMAAGEVVMFKTKLLHSSLINKTDKPRRAFSIGFIRADSYNVKTGKRYPRIFPEETVATP